MNDNNNDEYLKSGLALQIEEMKQKAGKLSPAAKLQMVMDLLIRQETHACSECGEDHTITKGLITEKDARKLLEL